MHNPLFPLFLVGGSPVALSVHQLFFPGVQMGISSKLRGLWKLLHLLLGETEIHKYKTLITFLFLKSVLGPGGNDYEDSSSSTRCLIKSQKELISPGSGHWEGCHFR